ncbi:MAG TPA: YceI family protein [Gemmatimonadales bacterium]|nr:YceI family protein [Gemmatimonadales bacterium]
MGLSAQGAPGDSVVFVLAATSRFEVRTGKAGLFGFLGHDHRIRARAVSGLIVYRPGAPTTSHVEIVVPADSLEVLTPADTAEIRKVTEAMRTDVLQVASYPEIRFVSTAVTPMADSLGVQGTLTLAGQTRDVSVAVAVTINGDTLRGTGTFAVKQTDFGIKPYRGGPAGTVQVADRVTFEFEALGIAQVRP